MNDHPPRAPSETPTLQAKVAFLSRPDSYTEQTSSVQVVRTHMSWVFLTDRYAYKLKRPVRLEFLDFSTLAARYRDCREEVRLNRRLAHDVYLGVEPLTRVPGVGLRLGGDAEPVEWLVKMRRLPRSLMLDEMIRQGTAREADIRRCGHVLADFYRRAPPLAFGPDEYRARIEHDIVANRRALADPAYQIAPPLIRHITGAQLQRLRDEPETFEQRVMDHRIKEGHGDLRPEHVCLGPEPLFIDCLEFNRDFRIVDAADELAYLALECEYAGVPSFGSVLFETYSEATGDRPPAWLMDFYKSCRATLRAKLSAWHIRDCPVGDRAKWIDRADRYLALAEHYARPP